MSEGSYEVPTLIVVGEDLGLEINAVLAFNNIVVAQTLVPGGIFEHSLTIHVNPSFLESKDAAGGEVNSAVVEIVSDGDLGRVSYGWHERESSSLTKALQFFIAHTWPM